MSTEVEHTAQQSKHEWHPKYGTFREWLDAEAPDIRPAQKKRNSATHNRRRLIKRQ